MVNILCLGGTDSPYHPFESYRPYLEHLMKAEGYTATCTEDMDALLPEAIRDFSVVLCCVSGKSLSPLHEQSLLEAMAGMRQDRYGPPKSFVGIHSASAAFLNSGAYHRMLGATFLAHPVAGPFSVHIQEPLHPITREMSPFSVEDELYLLETYGTFRTLWYTTWEEFSVPLGWVKPYGLGRVFYFSPGHSPGTWEHPSVRTILQRALRWAARIA
ncbi:MAG TPA: ThuA domain-containing protein [Termitinemataceae bacterium]|nr:ThuA domain-containing protein [Termitinemataceae bacterium]HOM22816.1 ThuA domain-containing protein [Termitinemataceae bacterium]HPP99757.1 ThuA domain-containing protein [Termitinemataceae bacterium]